MNSQPKQNEEELRTRVDELVHGTNLSDIRLIGWSGRAPERPRATRQIRFTGSPAQYRAEDQVLLCRFEHSLEYLDEAGEDFARIDVVQVAEFDCKPGLEFDSQVTFNWIESNVYFIIFPYLREALQSMAQRIGTDPVVLGVMQRDTPPLIGSVVIGPSETGDTDAS